MTALIVILCILLAFLIVWLAGNYSGWKEYSRPDPFNWRIFLGPRAYCRWLERTHGER